MRPSLLLLLLATCFLLRPGRAQDDDPGLEVGGEDKPAQEEGADDGGYDEDETRKKNVGLAGGEEDNGDDVNAPKVKADLQTRINKAIEIGVEWLKKRQDKDGYYGPVEANRHYGEEGASGKYYRDYLGPTAWAVYTLAKCGVKRSDPDLNRAMKYVFEQCKFVFDVVGGNPDHKDTEETPNVTQKNPRVLTTYEAAAIVMMIEAVYQHSAKLTGKHTKRRLYSDNPLKPPAGSKIPKDVWRFMHDRIIFLTVGRKAAGGGGGGRKGGRSGGGTNMPGAQVWQGDNKGGWRYGQGTQGDADLSATQFVLLALRAASQAGYPVEKVSPNVWKDAAEYVRKCQRSDGGFTYQRGGGEGETGSMAACGIGSLVICREQMLLAKEIDSDQPAPPAWIDEAIEKGLGWLDKNFVANRSPNGGRHYYYLYGVERVGDLTDRKDFNGKDWYTRGAEVLLAHQDADGKWTDGTAFPPQDVIGSCFALLFLKRATPPAVTFTGD